MDINDTMKVIRKCEQVLDLRNAKLGDEYFYQSLPLCVIDSVWSLGVQYESVKQVVIRYCDYFNLKRIRDNKCCIPPQKEQESISSFLEKFHKIGYEKFADEIFRNKQRTSTKNGILKSEAVFRFATVLKKFDINYLQDVNNIISNADFEREIKKIPGQTSGISLKYFFMLSGKDDFIKPDRMILNFLADTIGRQITAHEAQLLLVQVSHELKSKYPQLTPRLLDHAIWIYQRSQGSFL